MKQLLFLVLALLSVSMAMAQKQPERKDFTIKIKKLTGPEGEVISVVVGAYVGNKLYFEKAYEMDPPIDADLAGNMGSISEEDLNFDGYPDVDIYLGYMGGFANNTWHEALLWNQALHNFEEAEDYNIGEPTVVPEKKYIYNVLSAGPDHRVSSYYRWHGRKLVQYFTNTWAIESDDYVNFEGLLNYPCQRFDARLDGRIPVNIVFQRNENNDVAGYIYYPRAKKPAPIKIVGHASPTDDHLIYYLDEYQPDGTITGHITLQTTLEWEYPYQIEGTWTNPTTKKVMQMADMTWSQEVPTWFTKSLLP